MIEPVVTLEEAKLWCRIDADTDDLVVQWLIEAATKDIENRLRRPVISADDENAVCASISDVPPEIKLAALGIVSLRYEHREATSREIWDLIGTNNPDLDPYIDWSK